MEEVLYDTAAGVGRITINRPEQSNALNPAAIAALRKRLRQAEQEPAVRVVTITGAGDRSFCAGIDLKASLAGGRQAFGRSDFRQLLVDIARCRKPSVSLVRGHVMGGGLGIVLATDLSLACDDVQFSTPEITVGLFPMMVLGLLYRNLGRKRANEMAYLGERISATEAATAGLVNRVLPRAGFDSGAADYVLRLSEKSATILALGKKAVSDLLDRSLPEQEKLLEAALADLMETEDSREGIRAFVEKRRPRWN